MFLIVNNVLFLTTALAARKDFIYSVLVYSANANVPFTLTSAESQGNVLPVPSLTAICATIPYCVGTALMGISLTLNRIVAYVPQDTQLVAQINALNAMSATVKDAILPINIVVSNKKQLSQLWR